MQLIDAMREIQRIKTLSPHIYVVDTKPSDFDSLVSKISENENAFSVSCTSTNDSEFASKILSAMDNLIYAGYTSGELIGAKFFCKCASMNCGIYLPIVMLYFGKSSNFDDNLNYCGDENA